MIKAVIFDLDGTLIDTNDLIIETFQKVIRDCLGVNPTDDDLHHVYGKTLDEQMAYFSEERRQELVDAYRVYYRAHMEAGTHLFPGILSLLKALTSRNFKLATVTNKGARGVRHAFEKFDLEAYFTVSISADDVTLGKPDPEGILSALKALKVEAREALFVGDSLSDITAAKRAGVKSVLVGWTFFHEDLYQTFGADFILKEPLDLLALLAKLDPLQK